MTRTKFRLCRHRRWRSLCPGRVLCGVLALVVPAVPAWSLQASVVAATNRGVWSRDGKALAYAVTHPFDGHPEMRSDALYTVSAHGGHPTRRYFGRHEGIGLAGWWPDGKGLLFWRDPWHSASIAA